MFVTLLASFLLAPPFGTPALDTFDGHSWGTLRLASTTDKDLKKAFDTSKGGYRPEAIVLNKGERNGTRIEALMLGRGGNALVQGFRLTWPGAPEALDHLTQGFSGGPDMLYPRERYEDWAVAAYPERGIAYFLNHTERAPDVEMILLCDPSALKVALRGYKSEPSDVTQYQDPYANQPKLMEFGYTDVSYSVSGIAIQDRDYDASDLRRDLQRINSRGYVDYRNGSRGQITMSISCSYSASKGARVTISANAQGRTNYGPINLTTSDYRDIGKNQQTLRYLSLARSVMRDLEDKLETAISRQGPPPIEVFRRQAWDNLVEIACPRK